MQTQQKGFTLFELLIAMVIFSIVSLMAYGGLNTMIRTESRLQEHHEQLQRLQRIWLIMGQDLTHLSSRSIRDEFGDPRQPLMVADFGAIALELTRSGYSNPLNLPRRSELQRIGYGVVDKTLWRYHWNVLDRAPQTEPMRSRLAEGIESIKFQFLDNEGNRHEQWPPLGQKVEILPSGLWVILGDEAYGTIERLYKLIPNQW